MISNRPMEKIIFDVFNARGKLLEEKQLFNIVYPLKNSTE